MLRLMMLLVLTATVTAQDQKLEPAKASNYLQSLSIKSGGYLATNPGKSDIAPSPTLSATSSGVRAEKYLFGKIDNVENHASFVKNCFNATDGGFGQKPKEKADVVSTAIGLMAVAELGIDSTELITKSVEYLVANAKTFEERRIAAGGFEAVKVIPEVTKEWIAELRKTANPDGSYGTGPTKGRATGGATAFILRLEGTLTAEEHKSIVATLQREQQTDGAFLGADGKTTDLEATYRIMRAFYLLKEKPSDLAKLKNYLQKCQNDDGGFGRKPGEPSSVSGTYYFAAISKWIKVMDSAR